MATQETKWEAKEKTLHQKHSRMCVRRIEKFAETKDRRNFLKKT